jgi:hypothetical protein
VTHSRILRHTLDGNKKTQKLVGKPLGGRSLGGQTHRREYIKINLSKMARCKLPRIGPRHSYYGGLL